MIREIVLRYERPGKGTSLIRERVVLDRPDVKVLVGTFSSRDDLVIGDRKVLEEGARMEWFVFPGAWHDIARFHLADGSFTGWYTNLCTPVSMDGDDWSVTDLFLDHWKPVSGPSQWLDQDEFEEAAASGVLGADLVRAAREERARISAALAGSAWPPAVCLVAHASAFI